MLRNLTKRYGKKMKLILFFILISISAYSYANDIKISTVQMYCVDKTNKSYKYKVYLILKNISKKEIKLITKSSGIAAVLPSGGVPTEIIITYGEKKINGVPIIPTNEQLGFVILHSGEGAKIEHEHVSRKEVTSAIIQYNATAIYNNRFKNWVGSIKSKPISPIKIKACKP